MQSPDKMSRACHQNEWTPYASPISLKCTGLWEEPSRSTMQVLQSHCEKPCNVQPRELEASAADRLAGDLCARKLQPVLKAGTNKKLIENHDLSFRITQ